MAAVILLLLFTYLQGHLIDALKAVHLQLSTARERREKEQERKQKSVARYICTSVRVAHELLVRRV